MTEDELNEIRKRVRALPGGETWHCSKSALYSSVYGKDVLVFGFSDELDPKDFEYGESDLEFIAHARQDIPALLDEIDRLNKIIADQKRENIGE